MPKYELSELNYHNKIGNLKTNPVNIRGFLTNYIIETIGLSSGGDVIRICEIAGEYRLSEYNLDFHLRLNPVKGARIFLTDEQLVKLLT